MTRRKTHPPRVTIAANNGEIAGGEVMLLNIARACVELGVEVTVVGPAQPSGLVEAARAAGHRTVSLAASGRKEWMAALRRWDRAERDGILWCNGLVPALATAGRRNRIVHLHSTVSPTRRVPLAAARVGALATLVPSRWLAQRVHRARVFPNWVYPATNDARVKLGDPVFVIGFLGRPSVDKGVPVLAAALQRLERSHPGRFRLLIAGEPRFVAERDQRTVDEALASVGALVDRVGWIDRSDFFNQVDVVVCPSVAPETFGLVAAEAMSARTPLIVTDAGALPEVIGHGSPDIVPAADARALATAIARHAASTADPVATAQAGYDRWSAEFSPAAGRENTRQLLAHLGVATSGATSRS